MSDLLDEIRQFTKRPDDRYLKVANQLLRDAAKEIATLEAELARVKELAVWAAKHGVEADHNELFCGDFVPDAERFEPIVHDGTPSGILAALERAKLDTEGEAAK